jgi:hypothetical protein
VRSTRRWVATGCSLNERTRRSGPTHSSAARSKFSIETEPFGSRDERRSRNKPGEAGGSRGEASCAVCGRGVRPGRCSRGTPPAGERPDGRCLPSVAPFFAPSFSGFYAERASGRRQPDGARGRPGASTGSNPCREQSMLGAIHAGSNPYHQTGRRRRCSRLGCRASRSSVRHAGRTGKIHENTPASLEVAVWSVPSVCCIFCTPPFSFDESRRERPFGPPFPDAPSRPRCATVYD